MLEIKDLYVTVEGEEILKGFSLTVKPGEIHAIMGPNGAGKSTLAKVLAGHPSYEVTQGSIVFQGVEITELDPEERSHLGLFMSFQYPIEISGCSNFDFLFAMKSAQLKAKNQSTLSQDDFRLLLEQKLQIMNIREEFLTRDINIGFSGGEKKRNEILQMALLEPILAILDETDSGLDIDAMRIVADGIKKQMTQHNALILITHYQRLLDYLQPHFVHVVIAGKVVKTGDASLALLLEERGYDWLEPQIASV